MTLPGKEQEMAVTQQFLEKHKTAVILKDGSTLHLRPVVPGDEAKVEALFSRLSQHTLYLRFHHVLSHMSREEAKRFCSVDYEKDFALVGTLGEEEEEKIIALGHFYRFPSGDRAEAAFVVEDAYQGRGIGTLLLERLAQVAREMGINAFEAEVLAENQEMLEVLEHSGFHITEELSSGVYQLVMDLAPTPTVERMAAEREKVASIASLQAFLKPRSIAVIGASHTEGTIGNKVFRNLLYNGFQGVLYPVNPNAEVVASVKAYPSVLDVPGDVDLAIVIVPARLVYEVVAECGRKGVRGVVIISAGFAETGPEGAKRQKGLVDMARSYGMRMVGPNCMGVINTAPDVSMNATFSPVYPPTGKVAMASQSGALGLAILEYADDLNIGLSSFVSVGNRADVSSNDLLQYWMDDEATGVILLYLESFGNPTKFGRIARMVSAKKPVVAVKSGRTPAGSRAAASHTGALATADVGSDALFNQAGIIRVDSLEDLFDVANLLTHQPLPAGQRIGILTNGGGPGILTADACSARGLKLPVLSDRTLERLREILPAEASLVNPIDMTAGPGPEVYRQALQILTEEENIDVLIVIFIPPVVKHQEDFAAAIRDIAPLFRERGKTLVASFMGWRGAPPDLESDDGGFVPSFTFPEATAGALAKAGQYSEWLKRPHGKTPRFTDFDRRRARRAVDESLSRNPSRPLWLDAATLAAVLDSYGIRLVRSQLAKSADEAGEKAEAMGYPVAVKLVSDTISHKTEVGGVVLDLHSMQAVEAAFRGIESRLEQLGRKQEMQGVVVQEMVADGVEVLIGVTQDPSFGPLVMFGSGGIYAELFKDVNVRLHPLTDVDAREMMQSVKVYQLLEGWRGAEPADIEALEELLLRISAMVEDLPEIVELDLNPVKARARGNGYVVVDARVMVNDAGSRE